MAPRGHIWRIFGQLCLLVWLALLFLSAPTIVDWHLGSILWSQISLGLVLALSGGPLILTLVCYQIAQAVQANAQLKAGDLRREKAEVQAETQGDYVKSLERKIETLETALKQALAKSQVS